MLSALANRAAGYYRQSFDLRYDLGKATRCVIAFIAPLLLAGLPGVGFHYVFAGLAAQNVASYDVRGDYRLRIAVLLAASLIFAAAAALGAATGPGLAAAILTTALATIGSVVLRHLNADYGPGTGMTAMVIFAIALAQPGNTPSGILHVALWTLGGGLWGVLVQSALWPFRPQHPLRRVVAESWTAAAGLFATLKTAENETAATPRERHRRITERENAHRAALEKARAALHAAHTRRNTAFLERLENLATLSGELARRVVALATTLIGAIQQNPSLAELQPALQPILASLTNTSRTVAIAVISRQPSHLALAEVRVRRLGNLLVAYAEKVSSFAPAAASAADLGVLIGLINATATQLLFTLRATIDRPAERAAFSLELLDTDSWTLKPFANILNLRAKIDPVLLRFGARLTVLTIIGTIISKLSGMPHGYWLVFTIVLLMQPDYGATRQRVAHRLVGTFFGSLVASALLWLPIPRSLDFLLMVAAMFTFMTVLRRNYGVAVFFITIHVVFLTELNQALTLQFTLERVAATTLGGLLALGAALIFWPVWERSRIPKTLSAAIAANLGYWQTLFASMTAGGTGSQPAGSSVARTAGPCDDAPAPPANRDIAASARKVDAANSDVFGSLKRMMGDPASQREGLEESATIANGNQRLTRLLNVISLHLVDDKAPLFPAQSNIAECGALGAHALQTMSAAIQTPTAENAAQLAACRHAIIALRINPALDAIGDQAGRSRARQIAGQLVRAGTELNAMLLATEKCVGEGVFDRSGAPPPPGEAPAPRATVNTSENQK